MSDGQLNEKTSQGLNDKLAINLSNIPALPSGKSYYAWLLSDKKQNPTVSLLLGKLPVNPGIANLVYAGDQQQTDLLATYSRFLITEEDANSVPGHPSTDQSTWRYYAELPQTPSTTDKTTALDYLRFLLSEDLFLAPLNIHGGLNNRLYKSMQQVVGWADSASISEDPAFIHDQVINILDYLDGAPYVEQDVPPGTPLLADPTFSKVPIIDVETSQFVTSYLARMSNRLQSLEYSPGVTQETSTLANQIDLALTNVQTWLDLVRQYAKQLVNMKASQLLQPSSKSILIKMQTQAQNALYGSTDKEQEGIRQIYADIQHLATFNITLYKKP